MFGFATGRLLVLGRAGTSLAISVRSLGIWEAISAILKEEGAEGFWRVRGFWRGEGWLGTAVSNGKLYFFQVSDG